MNRLVIVALALLPCALATECNADNCARAVTGTRRGDDFVSSAQGDCSRFMQKTVTAPAMTITSTVAPPWYASACSGTVRYASACSCWGIPGDAVTITPTTTVTTTLNAAPTL
ncbi:small secreted protein [Beauveria bassiana ARSEF 2860]|uniref:Small secreted protein n=1 Tax=Beauveria bassiana (strain ARSEF 2860) TaxID=655819 RepID=J5K0V5_BEAB2|nr:small secreted protein [Beauveria bassiana ARSEF 2860]EJP67876.1 small secreted protein [Beauveria bassiana ARSEF 2860]